MTVTVPHYGLWLNGELTTGRGKPLEVLAPYNRELLWTLDTPDESQVTDIVAAARLAFVRNRSAWVKLERVKTLHAFADALMRDERKITHIICQEAGKPWNASAFEARRVSDYVRLTADALKLDGDRAEPLDALPGGLGRSGISRRVPLGVVLAVSPFNAPLNLLVQKVVPALAMGNAVIIKPSSYTPLTAWIVSELLAEGGVPHGMVHLIPAHGHDVVTRLAADPAINFVTLTGSTRAGEALELAAGLKPCAFELGSSAPNIVLRDVDVASLVPALAQAAFGAAGQACIAAQRILVHEDRMEELVSLLTVQAKSMKIGDPLDPATQIGPMISPSALERTLARIEDAKARGGVIVTGGQVTDNNLRPTIITQLPADDPINTEELFAPVVSVTPFATPDEAIELANSTPFGLQAAIFSRNIPQAEYVAEGLEFGSVWINETSRYRQDNYPFGGAKSASGYGREGIPYSFEGMSQWKFIGRKQF